MRDRFTAAEFQRSMAERLHLEMSAPTIVMGEITQVVYARQPEPSPGYPRIKTERAEVTVAVDSVLRGTVPFHTISFAYFIYSPTNSRDLGLRQYVPERGQYRIFFLTKDGERFRSVGDVTPYSLPVRTGRKLDVHCQPQATGCCIADLLLKPTDAADITVFTSELDANAYAAGVLCGPRRARELVRALRHYRNHELTRQVEVTLTILPKWWPELQDP
jgi:hypothetical protein